MGFVVANERALDMQKRIVGGSPRRMKGMEQEQTKPSAHRAGLAAMKGEVSEEGWIRRALDCNVMLRMSQPAHR